MNNTAEPFMALINAMSLELQMTSDLKDIDSQYHLRLLVRIILSTLEAFAYHLKQRALEAGLSANYPFSKAELKKLTEQVQLVSSNGSVETRKYFLKSQDNLVFAVAIFARVFGVSEVMAPPSTDLRVAVEIRDRLTHPKTAQAFTISEDERKVIRPVLEWYRSAMRWYCTAEFAHIERLRQEMHESIQEQRNEIRRLTKKPAV